MQLKIFYNHKVKNIARHAKHLRLSLLGNLVTIVLAYSCSIVNAHAMVVHDPANFFQNRITAMNSVKSLLEQIKSVKYQLSMYKNDLKNMRVLTHGVWADTHQELQKAMHMQMQGKVPSYLASDPARDFQEKFSYATKGENFQKNERNVSSMMIDVAKNSFSAAGLQARGFSEEDRVNKKLQALSEKSQGQMEALQTANFFSGMQISQLQKLRELMINQISVQANQLAFQVSREQARHLATSKWLQASDKNIPNYGSGRGFGPEQVTLN